MGAQQQPPSAPDPSKTFKEGIQIWLKNLPKMLQAEQKYRTRTDPKRIQEQQALQARFGPTQYAQQLQALQQLDPTGYAARQALGGRIGADLTAGGVDPLQTAGYRALMSGVTGEYNRGYDPGWDLRRQIEQSYLSRGNNPFGNAALAAQGVYTGARLQQLRQQRTQNLAGALGIQTPGEKALAQAGSYVSTIPSYLAGLQNIGSVQPDRSFAYANPQAGYMGQQFGLQNYPNQYNAAQQPNPWMNALGGAAGGAASGAMLGSVYPGIGTAAGAIGGGLIGGLGGYFQSDPKTKRDIKLVGKVPIYEYRYREPYRSNLGLEGTFRGPMSTDVKKLDSGAVVKIMGHDFVRSPNSLGLNRVKVKEE